MLERQAREKAYVALHGLLRILNFILNVATLKDNFYFYYSFWQYFLPTMKFISVMGKKTAILNKIYCSNFCIVGQWYNLKEAIFYICYKKTPLYTWSFLWTWSGGVRRDKESENSIGLNNK